MAPRLALASALVYMCLPGKASAHDFWVQPQCYWTAPKVTIPLTLQVGHGPLRQRSQITLDRIKRFQAISNRTARIDLHSVLTLGAPAQDGQLDVRLSGTYMLVLQTDARAHSDLPAIRYNDYLRYEGLTPALEWRERTHRMDADGSENYSRQAKTIVQVGKASGSSATAVTRPAGLILEIVPAINPYTSPRLPRLPVQVLFESHPLSGALVMLTNLAHDATPVEKHITDRSGNATFRLPHEGSWLLNVVWTKLLPPWRDTDFETTFSSLSFGFPSKVGGCR